MTSPSSAASVAASDTVSRQMTPASSRWLRLRLYGSGGSGGRVLPSALLSHRRRHASSSSLPCRDYGVDKLTDAVFHEFLRHDPLLDVRQSPLIAPSRDFLDSVATRSVDCVTVHRQGRPVSGVCPLTAHVEENESDRLHGGTARRTSPNCRSAAARNISDAMTTVCRDTS